MSCVTKICRILWTVASVGAGSDITSMCHHSHVRYITNIYRHNVSCITNIYRIPFTVASVSAGSDFWTILEISRVSEELQNRCQKRCDMMSKEM